VNREENLSYLKETPNVSVLIIGAGVNGIGTFRDLALQGVDVYLVDKGDFCSGASAASSHMVHGGIRYLENGEFRLVREAVQERNRLIENAPHYVHPLPTVIPIFKWFSGLLNAPIKFLGLLNRPAERGGLVIKLGLIFYDAFARRQGTVPKHKFRLRKDSLRKYPKLNPAIQATARYYDAAMPSPERICIDMLMDAHKASPKARAVNYVQAIGASGDTVQLKDNVTGEKFSVQPQILINAAGPWIDITNRALGNQTRMIGGTKGSHLVLKHQELRDAIGENEFFFENDDGRIVLIYPFKERVMVGTSDLPIDNPDDAECTEEEIDYFLEMLKIVFPTIEVSRENIVYKFSGVRPLPSNFANSTGQISRDHKIEITPPGNGLAFSIYSLVGGKWTSFRAFSEETADAVLSALEKQRIVSTKKLAIGGGKNYPNDPNEWCERVANKYGLAVDRVMVLFERYGTRAEDVANFISLQEDRSIISQPDFSSREIKYLVNEEMVVALDDFLYRRSLLGMLGKTSSRLIDELHAELKKT
jgi:glycerol-3-phosphate dehydrogenase